MACWGQDHSAWGVGPLPRSLRGREEAEGTLLCSCQDKRRACKKGQESVGSVESGTNSSAWDRGGGGGGGSRLLGEKKNQVKENCGKCHSVIKMNKTVPFAEMWLDLETIKQSEVSQKSKSKCYILTHICGIQKNGTEEPIFKAGIETET